MPCLIFKQLRLSKTATGSIRAVIRAVRAVEARRLAARSKGRRTAPERRGGTGPPDTPPPRWRRSPSNVGAGRAHRRRPPTASPEASRWNRAKPCRNRATLPAPAWRRKGFNARSARAGRLAPSSLAAGTRGAHRAASPSCLRRGRGRSPRPSPSLLRRGGRADAHRARFPRLGLGYAPPMRLPPAVPSSSTAPPPCGAAPTKGKRHPLHGSRPLRSPRTVPLPPFAPRSAATFPGVRRPRAGDMRAIARKTPARSADRRPNAAGRAALLFGPLPSATLSLPPPNKATAARFRIPSRRATPQLHPAPLASCAGPLGRGPVPPLGRSTPSVDARLKRYGPPADFFSMEIGSRPSAPFRGRTRFPLPSPSPRPLPLSAPFL